MSEERKIINIPIHKIIPNIYQPRIKFDDKSIEELSNSIKKHGIIQPLILRELGNSYEIIDGERRYKAAKKLGITEIPSIIINVDEKEAAELILTENMQKQLLTPIEEANAYQQIMLLNKFDIETLAKKLGKDKNIIESKLKLLTLIPEIQSALLNNKIAEGHAKALTKVLDKRKQYKLFERTIKERIPVKALEEIIKQELNNSNDQAEEYEPIINKDKVSLNDLNKQELMIKKEENKMEEEKMDNTQLNFNQYNNLIKEKELPELGINEQPQPILGNTIPEPKQNEFFPSLEDQPLNMEIPVSNQQDTFPTMNMPQFEVPVSNMMPEQPIVQPEIPTMPEASMYGMPGPMNMPQFEVPASNMMPEQPIMQPEIPTMPEASMYGMPGPMNMPQFEVPASNMMPEQPIMQPEIPTMPEAPMYGMPGPMNMPQFEVPASNMMPEQPIVQPEIPAMPEASMYGMPGPMNMPQFEVPASNMMPEQPIVQPEIPAMPEASMYGMPGQMNMPQFEVPASNMMPEQPVMDIHAENILQEQPISQPVMIDVMPAVNMVRNLIPLLENSGYKILIEESDNINEYQIVLKVQK